MTEIPKIDMTLTETPVEADVRELPYARPLNLRY